MDKHDIMRMIEQDVKADIHGDLYGHDRVAEDIAAHIAGLKARIKKLEDQLSEASWQREYTEVMGRNGSGMDGGW